MQKAMAGLRTITGAAVLFLIAGMGAAEAHGTLTRAHPPAGGTIKRAPSQISLWFSEPLEHAFSRLEVYADDGERVDTGNIDAPADAPTRLTVGVKALKPGSYRVNWRVLSVDAHVSSGTYTFRVAP
jgi:methionine-rich copper-binding protein CopC